MQVNEAAEFRWPDGDAECATLARSLFVNACVEVARHWTAFGTGLVTKPKPDQPFVREWNEAAKRDRAYREAFATLTETQRGKVLELLEQCVRGAVFSTLCTLDQFPHGEAEVWVQDGVGGEGRRRFSIAPTAVELHDEFGAAMHRAAGVG
jgi:hypothetical protein